MINSCSNRAFDCSFGAAPKAEDSLVLNEWISSLLKKRSKKFKPYRCQFCGMRFTQKGNLTVHQRLHLGLKPFICFICKKRFSRKQTLISHFRTHTKEKPFKCNICCSRFAQVSQKNRHVLTHGDGKKPFACKLCEKSFSDKRNLMNHLKSAHPNESQKLLFLLSSHKRVKPCIDLSVSENIMTVKALNKQNEDASSSATNYPQKHQAASQWSKEKLYNTQNSMEKNRLIECLKTQYPNATFPKGGINPLGYGSNALEMFNSHGKWMPSYKGLNGRNISRDETLHKIANLRLKIPQNGENLGEVPVKSSSSPKTPYFVGANPFYFQKPSCFPIKRQMYNETKCCNRNDNSYGNITGLRSILSPNSFEKVIVAVAKPPK